MSLERVETCPACGSAERQIEHEAVPDFVFRATEERWTIAACGKCKSLYLFDRPDAATIGRYYARYYTRPESPDAVPEISGIHVRSDAWRRLANSWRNERYGTRRRSFGRAGAWLVRLCPPLRHWLDAECRHLLAVGKRGGDYRVLDVGCGDGRFVQFAADAGCVAQGMEVDEQAVALARSRGLDVRLGDAHRALQIFGRAAFDHVTLSHVIEHVHDPRSTLATLRDLLKPGGRLWLETPNPASFGHRLFRARWRDLDPPRHLCLLSEPALVDAAAQAGLRLSGVHARPFVPFETFPFSENALAQAEGRRPRGRLRVLFMSLLHDLRGWLQPAGREWLTLVFERHTIAAEHPGANR
jgi:2-polyprenyl-3-methyl-5-hydroxy-6-metoxy-1,4-benzoquinol methylase